MPTPKKRLLLEKEFKEKLKLYFFIRHPINMPLPIGVRIDARFSYRAEDAIETAIKQSVEPHIAVTYTGDFIHANDLLDNIHDMASDRPKELSISTKPIGFDNFKNCLHLAANEYATDKDKISLKKIIDRLKEEKIKV